MTSDLLRLITGTYNKSNNHHSSKNTVCFGKNIYIYSDNFQHRIGYRISIFLSFLISPSCPICDQFIIIYKSFQTTDQYNIYLTISFLSILLLLSCSSMGSGLSTIKYNIKSNIIITLILCGWIIISSPSLFTLWSYRYRYILYSRRI